MVNSEGIRDHHKDLLRRTDLRLTQRFQYNFLVGHLRSWILLSLDCLNSLLLSKVQLIIDVFVARLEPREEIRFLDSRIGGITFIIGRLIL